MLFMNDDFLISRLRLLCQRFADSPLEGRYYVATKAGLSEQYLYQILSGKPMANGQKRSVGKVARNKITTVFPDWIESELNNFPDGKDIDREAPQAINFVPKKSAREKKIDQIVELLHKTSDTGINVVLDSAKSSVDRFPLISKLQASGQ